MFQYFLSAARNEINRLLNNKRDFVILIGGPILYMVLFGFLYSYNVVNHIDTVVWDQDNTSLSRTVVNYYGDSDRFNIIGSVDNQDELKKYIDSGKAKVGLVIPKNFMKDVKKQHGSQVLVCIDGTNMIISNAVVSSSIEIIQTISGGIGIKMMEGGGTLPGKAYNTVAPISFRPRIWYNPTFGYSDFLLLGLLGTVIQQILLLFASLAIVRDKNAGTVPETGFAGMSAYVLGKSIPYIIINYLNMNLVFFILIVGFGLRFDGNIFVALFLEAIFIIALVSLGVFLSIISKNELEATQVAMLLAVPSFLVSGYTWPLQAMPIGVQAVSRVLPLTYFVSSFRDIALKGVGLKEIFPSIAYLVGLTVVLFPASIIALKRHIRSRHSYEEAFSPPA